MKKQLSLLLVPLYLTSCISTPEIQTTKSELNSDQLSEFHTHFEFIKLSACAEENAARAPSSINKCQKYYEPDKSISEKEESIAQKSLVEALSGKTKLVEQFGQTENLGLWAMYFEPARINEMLRKKNHPIDFLTDREVKSFSTAWRTLKEIRDDKFILSSVIMLEVNKMLSGDLETLVMKELNPKIQIEQQNEKQRASLLSSIKNYLSAPGGYRTRAKKEDFTFENITEAEFVVIKKNFESYGGKIEETFFSTENNRSFVITYPSSEYINSVLPGIFKKANQNMIALKDKSFAEKIDFVADLHMQLYMLQPFKKYNDLTIQMILNRVLLQLGLDPAVTIPIDLTLSKDQVAELYRNGIAEYLNYTVKTYDINFEKNSNEIYAEKEAGSITARGAGLRVKIIGKYAKKYPKATALMRTKDRVTPFDGRSLAIGKDQRLFVLKDDGLLYEGIIPHTIRVENGRLKLYPLSDYSYRLLGLNGNYTGEKGTRRDITAEHQELLRVNLENLENLLDGKIKPENFEIVYNKELMEANKAGALYLYEWQLPSLERSVKINEDPIENPYAALIPSRGDPLEPKKGGRTTFEQNFFRGSRGNKIGDLIGQYEQRDLDYNQLAREIKRNNQLSSAKKQRLIADIMESRRKLHQAAREILKPFLSKVEGLNTAELKQLRGNAHFYQLEDFINNFSKLRFETLDQAIAQMGDDYVYVHRVQAKSLTNLTGLRSQVELKTHPLVRLMTLNGWLVPQYREIYQLMENPQAVKQLEEQGTLSSKIKIKIAEIARGNKVAEGIISSIILRIYAKRGKDIQNVEEFQSLFMNHLLHAVNRGSKVGISTTSDPTYLLSLKSYTQLSALEVDPVLVGLFKEYKKDSKDAKVEAKLWLESLAAKEKKQKLDPEYYELSWAGGFAKDFNVPIKTVVGYVEAQNKKSNGDKFTNLSSSIYVLRIPVEEIDSNYASGYSGQFEDTTRKGYGVIKSKWGIIARPIIQREYMDEAKFGVNISGLNENSKEVYNMLFTHLEPNADFTTYLTFQGKNTYKHQDILGNLFVENKKDFQRAIEDLKSLKYDLSTIKTTEQVEAFKVIVEDVFNTALKVAANQSESANRKLIIENMSLFLRNHSSQRYGERVSQWALELWEAVAENKDYGKELISRAKREVLFYKGLLGMAASADSK